MSACSFTRSAARARDDHDESPAPRFLLQTEGSADPIIFLAIARLKRHLRQQRASKLRYA
jgi:hypothetical protein